MVRRPTAGWRQAPAWGIPMDPDPLPLRTAGQLGRWLWPVTAVGSFLVVVGYVFSHDPPPHPGLSDQGLLTVALAAVVVVLLTVRRAAGPGPLARAMAEYAVVAVVAVLLATASVGGPEPRPAERPSHDGKAATLTEGRPALVRLTLGVWDWLADLWRRADQETERRSRPSSTSRPTPTEGQAMAPSPTHPPRPDRRPL